MYGYSINNGDCLIGFDDGYATEKMALQKALNEVKGNINICINNNDGMVIGHYCRKDDIVYEQDLFGWNII